MKDLLEKEVKDHVKRNVMHLKRFKSMGKKLKV